MFPQRVEWTAFLGLSLKEFKAIIVVPKSYKFIIMKNLILNCLAFALFASSSLAAYMNEPLFGSGQEEKKIYINNRILNRVNGKPISTYDLMKKIDLVFYREYPEYTSSIEARSEFYAMSWKIILAELINKELILADANESKITVSSGDVRQELESSFGPNIIANLDKAGLTFDEAYKMMEEEIIIKRMKSGRVYAKAFWQVTPTRVRQAYEEFIQDPVNSRLNQWSYRMVTIKERTLEKSEETAKAAHQMLLDGTSLDDLEGKLKEANLLGKKGKVTVSNTIKQNDQELSVDYLENLSQLSPGMYSKPFPNKSRANNAMVYRILLLQDKIAGGVPTYKEMEPILKDRLLEQALEKETDVYLAKLRKHYHISENDIEAHIPADYEPFTLR